MFAARMNQADAPSSTADVSAPAVPVADQAVTESVNPSVALPAATADLDLALPVRGSTSTASSMDDQDHVRTLLQKAQQYAQTHPSPTELRPARLSSTASDDGQVSQRCARTLFTLPTTRCNASIVPNAVCCHCIALHVSRSRVVCA